MRRDEELAVVRGSEEARRRWREINEVW